MSYNHYLNKIANALQEELIKTGGIELPTEDFGWTNIRYMGNKYRMAHIERYSDKSLEVLHFTCFPNKYIHSPIFGLDIITTNSKPLAAFMDWSPVCDNIPMKIDFTFEKQYPLPDWAKVIFSPQALAIIPNDTELSMLTDIATDNFKKYINLLNETNEMPEITEYIIAGQNRYCEHQQMNARTYNVLKAKLGSDRAKYFMDNILFPKIG